MGSETKIPWCDHTLNLWWGCQEVSPGCDHCYARRIARRFNRSCWGSNARRILKNPLPNVRRWAKRAEENGTRPRVLVQSMGDVFEGHRKLVRPRLELAGIVARFPRIDFLLLTKRPENAERLWKEVAPYWVWPDNVWLGVTVESQAQIKRIEVLEKIPTYIRFVSIEPLLGPVNLRPYLAALDWVIVGDESGPDRRSAKLDWVRDLRDQCVKENVSFYFKQFHDPVGKKLECPKLDGRQWIESPLDSPF